MKNKIAIIIGIVVVLLIVFISNGKGSDMGAKDNAMEKDSMVEKENDVMMKDDSTMEKEEGTMMEKEGSVMMSKGSYEVYAPEKLAMANKGDVVLFFRASWCPTCKALDADIKANLSLIPDGLVILDVDYDNSKELKQKYGVTYQHTLVQVDANGNMITKWSGSPTLSSLIAQVK